MININRNIERDKKVFVAMSGGVDSSVVAALLKDQGYHVIGVTMCFSITHPESKKPSCCGVDGIQDAKRAAQILNIPHYVLDFAQDINKYIIDDFTNEYLSGRTPNPCARCNQHLKFGTLFDKIRSLGGEYLATGHYAKIHYNEENSHYEMKKAEDQRKCQSYFLYTIDRDVLPHLLFPLGDLTKDEVRSLAQKYDLNTADKPESQDICFVPDSGYKKFIEDRLGKDVFVEGDFIDENGTVVGRHKGLANYTIGQRDKLGIALGHPVYVNKIDREHNTVHVGPESCLFASGLKATQFNPVSRAYKPGDSFESNIQIRYNSREFRGRINVLEDQNIEVIFDHPQKSITPGQSVVFYKGDVVLGGATIQSPIGNKEQVFDEASTT